MRVLAKLVVLLSAFALFGCYPQNARQPGVYVDSGPGTAYPDARHDTRRVSDRSIHDEIHAMLRQDPYIDAAGIQVHVHHGSVTLTGYVDSASQARRAHDLAHQAYGVQEVVNRLTVVG